MFAVIFIVAVGIVTAAVRQGLPGELHQPFRPLEGHEPTASSVALALYGVMWAFDGWLVPYLLCMHVYCICWFIAALE